MQADTLCRQRAQQCGGVTVGVGCDSRTHCVRVLDLGRQSQRIELRSSLTCPPALATGTSDREISREVGLDSHIEVPGLRVVRLLLHWYWSVRHCVTCCVPGAGGSALASPALGRSTRLQHRTRAHVSSVQDSPPTVTDPRNGPPGPLGNCRVRIDTTHTGSHTLSN